MKRFLLFLLVLALLLSGCGGAKTTEIKITPAPAPTVTPAPKPKETLAPTPEPTPELLPLDSGDESAEAPDRASSIAEPEPVLNTYVLNTNSKKIHKPSCSSVGDILPKNRKDVTGTLDDFVAQGYAPCKRCKPR